MRELTKNEIDTVSGGSVSGGDLLAELRARIALQIKQQQALLKLQTQPIRTVP